MDCYVVEFIFENSSYFCIWETKNVDMFYTNENFVIFFTNILKLCSYCEEKQINVDISSILEFNLNFFDNYFVKNRTEIDCEKILNYWNIFSDMARSVNDNFIGDEKEVDYIYEKLFYGNNLETINKSGKEYIPIFTSDEYNILKKVMQDGKNIVVRQLQIN